MNRISKQPLPHEVRTRQIIDILESNGHLQIAEMAEKFYVSEITIRRDLDELENKGLLLRTHGGAIRNKKISDLFSFNAKASRNQKEKLDICTYAATLIEEGDIIYMDCGTTVYLLASFLGKFNNLRVLTNSLGVVSELIPFSQIKVSVLGGELDHERRAVYGATTEAALSKLRAPKAFVGAAGISLANGLSSNDEKEATTVAKMVEIAKKVIVLCDSSKFEHDAYITYSPLDAVDMIITDSHLNPDLYKKFREQNVNLVLAT